MGKGCFDMRHFAQTKGFWFILLVLSLGVPGCGSTTASGALFSNSYSITHNGTTQYLSVPSAGIAAYPFAMSVWVKTTSVAAGTIMGLFNPAATNQFFRISMTATGTVSLTAQNTIARTVTSTATVNNGAWHHVVAVFSSATSRTLYIDGVNQGVNATSVTFTTLASTIAVGVSKTSAPSVFFSGQIDEPAFWNSDLLSANVTALYNSGASKDLIGSSGLYSWWRMGDASGDDLPGAGTIVDQVATRNFVATAFSGVSPTAGAP